MEIILLENILNLGNIGDKVNVKNGYGRNYLLKHGKALRFSKDNLELVNKRKVELNKKNTEAKDKFKEIALLEKTTIETAIDCNLFKDFHNKYRDENIVCKFGN